MYIHATARTGPHEGRLTLPSGSDRRMARIQRMAFDAAYSAIGRAGRSSVDGIFSSTALGCLEDTERFLLEMDENRGTLLSPLPFMRSTHNTMAGQLAMLAGVRGPNITFSHGLFGLHAAFIQARLHLLEHPDQHVLVLAVDERTPLLSAIVPALQEGTVPGEGAEAFVLSGERGEHPLARIEKVALSASTSIAGSWSALTGAPADQVDHVLIGHDAHGGPTDWLVGGTSVNLSGADGLSGVRTAQLLAAVIDQLCAGTIQGRVLIGDRSKDEQGAILLSSC